MRCRRAIVDGAPVTASYGVRPPSCLRGPRRDPCASLRWLVARCAPRRSRRGRSWCRRGRSRTRTPTSPTCRRSRSSGRLPARRRPAGALDAAKSTEQDLAERASGFRGSGQRIEERPEWSAARVGALAGRAGRAARRGAARTAAARAAPAATRRATTSTRASPYLAARSGGTARPAVPDARCGPCLAARAARRVAAGCWPASWWGATAGAAARGRGLRARADGDLRVRRRDARRADLSAVGLSRSGSCARVVRRGAARREVVGAGRSSTLARARGQAGERGAAARACLVSALLRGARRARCGARARPLRRGLAAVAVAARCVVPGGPRRFLELPVAVLPAVSAGHGRRPAAAAVAGCGTLARGDGRARSAGSRCASRCGSTRCVGRRSRSSSWSPARCAALRPAPRRAVLVVFALPAVALVAGLHLTEDWFLVRRAQRLHPGALPAAAAAARRRAPARRCGAAGAPRRGVGRGLGLLWRRSSRRWPSSPGGSMRRALAVTARAGARRACRAPRSLVAARDDRVVVHAVGLPAVAPRRTLAPGDELCRRGIDVPRRSRACAWSRPRAAPGRRWRCRAPRGRRPSRGARRRRLPAAPSRRASAPCRRAGASRVRAQRRRRDGRAARRAAGRAAGAICDPAGTPQFAVVLRPRDAASSTLAQVPGHARARALFKPVGLAPLDCWVLLRRGRARRCRALLVPRADGRHYALASARARARASPPRRARSS